MHFAFDLISDLHVETWDKFDWDGQPTSPYCVVAGDVSRDPEILRETLEHLGQKYAGVFYIDGNDEHRYYLENLTNGYHTIQEAVKDIPNVVYLQDNCVIINGVAIISTNGWWTYDFDKTLSLDQSISWYQEYLQIPESSAVEINSIAYHDAAYIINSVNRLQKQRDVNHIVIVTHTVPAPWIVEHDIDFVDNYRTNIMGNRYIQNAIEEDTENKIKAWCFGHYHKSVDRYFAGIRYVSNPRGRGDTQWSQNPYYPKRIEIEL